MQENSSNAKHAFSVQDIRVYSLHLRQVYVQSNAAQHAPRQHTVFNEVLGTQSFLPTDSHFADHVCVKTDRKCSKCPR